MFYGTLKCWDAWPKLTEKQKCVACKIATVQVRNAFKKWDEIPLGVQLKLRGAMQVQGWCT
jgi:hypothetical protein